MLYEINRFLSFLLISELVRKRKSAMDEDFTVFLMANIGGLTKCVDDVFILPMGIFVAIVLNMKELAFWSVIRRLIAIPLLTCHPLQMNIFVKLTITRPFALSRPSQGKIIIDGTKLAKYVRKRNKNWRFFVKSPQTNCFFVKSQQTNYSDEIN